MPKTYASTKGSSGTGTVTSVTGTANRISVSTGTTTPVIDIDAAYVGQVSITTLGTITTGVWSGTAIVDGKLASSYVLADGTRPLTANWNMGAFSAESKQTVATAATIIDGFKLTNTTLAAAAAQQYSPAIHWTGQGWKTTATAASQTVEARMYLVPVQGTTTPLFNLIIDGAFNGGAFGTFFTLGNNGSNTGSITIAGALNANNAVITATITSAAITSTQASLAATSTDGIVSRNQTAATSGVPIQQSPRFRVSGQGWTGAASQTADFAFETRPINGTSPITANWVLMSQINAAGYNDRLTVSSGGNVTVNNGNLSLATAGNALLITEGSNGRVGQTTLVAGTKAITITGLTTSSRAFPGFVSQGGTSTGVFQYAMVCTANTLTITAVTVAGVTVATDTSVINYFVIN